MVTLDAVKGRHDTMKKALLITALSTLTLTGTALAHGKKSPEERVEKAVTGGR